MANQEQTPSLLSRIAHRAKQVQAEVAKIPINYGNPSLPAGINNGIAQLDWIRFKEYDKGPYKGQLFFMAMGTVKSPVKFGDTTIAGWKTSIGPIALCDTKDSNNKETLFITHWNAILDEVCKLGDIKKETVSVENLEAISKKLTAIRPFFNFSTSAGKKQTTGPYTNQEPRVFHNWHGRCEYNEVPVDPMNDKGSTNGQPSSNGDGQHQLEDKSSMDTPEPFNEFDNPSEESNSGGVATEDVKEMTPEEKLEYLVNLADDTEDDSDEANDARKQLQEMFKKVGVTEQEIIDSNSHRELVSVMDKKIEESVKKEVEEKAKKEEKPTTKKKVTPEVGKTCKYQKNSKSKAMDCEIMNVNLTAGIVTLKDMATDQIFKGVKIDNIKMD